MAAQDEATFGLLPSVARGWAKKGSHPVAKQAPKHKKLNVFGARSTKAFVYQFSKNKNQRTFVGFVKKLLKRWGRLCLFVDNARWHRGRTIDELLQSHPKTLKIIYFPPIQPRTQPRRTLLETRPKKTRQQTTPHPTHPDLPPTKNIQQPKKSTQNVQILN